MNGRRGAGHCLPPSLPTWVGKHMNRLLLGAALILVLGAALQVHRLLVGEAGPLDALGPGDTLPPALGFESEPCWSGFLVNTECSFCRELIARAHQREDPHWIIAGARLP
jgi:hypothetical protein